jgi:hypothetical protein
MTQIDERFMKLVRRVAAKIGAKDVCNDFRYFECTEEPKLAAFSETAISTAHNPDLSERMQSKRNG